MSRHPAPIGPPIPIADAVDAAQARELRSLAGQRGADPAAPWLPPFLARLGAGAPGGHPGRIGWPISIPAHWDSTAAICALYPWLVAPPPSRRGAIWGRDAISGASWSTDPWRSRAAGVGDDTGILITGVIGSGKSAAAKSLALRHIAFGRPFLVPGDIRGEWVPVAQAVDGTVLRLGPGMPDRLNILAAPPKPPDVNELTWWRITLTHWHQLLISTTQTLLPGQRELQPEERTGIELALTEATRWKHAGGSLNRLRPISLRPVVDLLLEPTPEMATDMHLPTAQLRDLLRQAALSLRELVHGLLAGLVDDDRPAARIDPDASATVIDLSRVHASDAALALVMSCTQATLELAVAHRPGQRWQIYDELWRLMRFPALLRRLNAGQRTSRRSGAATVLITHRVSDGNLGGPHGASIMADLIADCATKILYRQRIDALDALRHVVPLTDAIAALLPSLPRGRAIHLNGDTAYLIDHLVPPPPPGRAGVDRDLVEWDVLETDHVLSDNYRTLTAHPGDGTPDQQGG